MDNAWDWWLARRWLSSFVCVTEAVQLVLRHCTRGRGQKMGWPAAPAVMELCILELLAYGRLLSAPPYPDNPLYP